MALNNPKMLICHKIRPNQTGGDVNVRIGKVRTAIAKLSTAGKYGVSDKISGNAYKSWLYQYCCITEKDYNTPE